MIEENKFILGVKRHAFVNRLNNRYKQKNEQDIEYYFSREAIDALMVDVGKNWKLCPLDFEISQFAF